MKRVLLVSLVLAMALTLLAPSVVLAAKPQPVDWSGNVTGITDSFFDPGTLVLPAGDSGRWRVVTRDISGIFTGGALAGTPFVLNYQGNVNALQKGNIHGRLSCGDAIFEINGKSAEASFYGVLPADFPVPGLAGAPLFALSIEGQWTCLEGDWGTGAFAAAIIFVTDGVHIYWVHPYVSTFAMYGK